MLRPVIIAVVLALPAVASATDADGVWKTAVSDSGGYLEVTIAPCDSDNSLTCGTITRAFNAKGEDPDYANIGKPIVENMTFDGDGNYSDGTIWDPEHDKTYNSKMSLDGDTLDVEGCIAFLCSGQDWTRVK